LKLLVISDTHGHIERAIRLLPLFTDLDAIIHLGDYLRDAEQLQKYTEVQVIAVGGNGDGVFSKTEAIKTIDSPFGTIVITHGHLHSVRKGIDRLIYQAAECEAKAVLFGHTHTPFYGVFEGVSLVNPGSLSFPSQHNQGTYAVLTIDESGISCALVNYQDPPIPISKDDPPSEEQQQINPHKKTETGGFLRDILNNSDRF
jgi:uncharacterized protein